MAQMKAWEVLSDWYDIENCPECHCATGEDTEYKDYTCKTIAICTQCGYEFDLGLEEPSAMPESICDDGAIAV